VYYRGTEQIVDEQYSIQASVSCPSNSFARASAQILRLSSFPLSAFAFDQISRPAPSGSLWLTMTGVSESGGNGWPFSVPASRWTLTLPNGRSVAGTATSEPGFGFAVNYLTAYGPIWRVPEDFTSGTITVDPGRGQRQGCSIDYEGRVMTIPVRIPLQP
jgi:hypothetical protein